jgi:acetyl-CoA carboxylase biotin carboxyl carrier protein
LNKISQQDLESLLELFDRSSWREMRVQGLGVELFVSKDPNARLTDPVAAPRAAQCRGDATIGCSAPSIAAPPPVEIPGRPGRCTSPLHTGALGARARCPASARSMARRSRGSPPFVAVGQRVTADTGVCIVEVMKLFTTFRAGVAGTVRDVLVKDSDLVEFDQALILIEPDA